MLSRRAGKESPAGLVSGCIFAMQNPRGSEKDARARMVAFILRRFASLLVVLFCVVTITFLLVRLAPGGPFSRERKIPEHIEKQLLARYKLDGTLWQQYTDYLGDLVRGDLRLSTKFRDRSVNELIGQSLPVSAQLGIAAFLIATFGGIWLGSLAAVRHRTWIDATSKIGRAHV